MLVRESNFVENKVYLFGKLNLVIQDEFYNYF